MGHAFTSWWIGSDLSIEESRRLDPPKTQPRCRWQFGRGRGEWMIQNPIAASSCRRPAARFRPGYRASLLGTSISTPSKWTPLMDLPNAFEGYNKADFDLEDPWQFKNFLVKEGD